MRIPSNLSGLDVHRALHRAFPGEGFHVHTVTPHQHDVTPDNEARTEVEIREALDGWKAGGGLDHAKAAMIRQAEAAASASLAAFRITSEADDEMVARGWAAHVRIVMREREAALAAIKGARNLKALRALNLHG